MRNKRGKFPLYCDSPIHVRGRSVIGHQAERNRDKRRASARLAQFALFFQSLVWNRAVKQKLND